MTINDVEYPDLIGFYAGFDDGEFMFYVPMMNNAYAYAVNSLDDYPTGDGLPWQSGGGDSGGGIK